MRMRMKTCWLLLRLAPGLASLEMPVSGSERRCSVAGADQDIAKPKVGHRLGRLQSLKLSSW